MPLISTDKPKPLDKKTAILENATYSTGEKTMFSAALCSSFCLFASLLAVHPSVEMMYQEHLETTEGRVQFLTEKVVPYAAVANELNEEILRLSDRISSLSPETDQAEILALTEEATQKMGKLSVMLPALNLLTSLEEDFDQIETILEQADELTVEQQETADRIALLCQSIQP